MAKLSHLVLYDPDPNGLETLSYVFEKEGCRVGGTTDGAKAAELVQTEGAALVLVALRAPEQAAVDLIREITRSPRTRNVACVAIGPARWRGPALEAGAFGLLASPVFLRDVLDASKLVAAAMVVGSRPSPDSDVTLKLSELGGVYYLIRALAASGRSAAVDLSRGPRRGELRFIDGELSSVQIGSLSGMPALYQLLLWEEADLRLKFRNVVRRAGQLSFKNGETIEACDRFLRDFAHDVSDLGVSGTIYRLSSDARPTASLPSEVVPLLRLFDGERTLAQILEESPFRVFDTLRIVHQFATAGAIRADTVPAPKPSRVPPGPATLAAWFQHPSVLTEADRPTPPPQPVAAPQPSGRSPRRPSAPFVPVEPLRPTDGSAIPRAAKRTQTRRDYFLKPPDEPSQSRKGSQTQKTPPVQGLQPALEVTPPALPSSGVPIAERPRTPSGAVARGEIQIPASLPLNKKIEKGIKPTPSVLVELSAVPQDRPLAPVIEAPLTAAHPRVGGIVAPTVVPPVPVKGPVVLRKKTPVAGSAEPARPPAGGFSAMEADFFEREADLYKRESVETFDDLEGGAGTHRDSARKI